MPSARLRLAEDLAGKIRERVNDPALMHGPVLRIAWAVVEGLLPAAKLHQVLDRVRGLASRGRIRVPGAYFVGAMKEVFRLAGLPWKASQSIGGQQSGGEEVPVP
jgi:hypothetical protein